MSLFCAVPWARGEDDEAKRAVSSLVFFFRLPAPSGVDIDFPFRLKVPRRARSRLSLVVAVSVVVGSNSPRVRGGRESCSVRGAWTWAHIDVLRRRHDRAPHVPYEMLAVLVRAFSLRSICAALCAPMALWESDSRHVPQPFL